MEKTERYAKRQNRTDLIKKATVSELIPLINKLGVSHASLRYKCIKKDVVNRLVQLKVEKVIVPTVKVTDNEIVYMYKEKNIQFISKNLGTDAETICDKLIQKNIRINYCEEEGYIAVDKEEVTRLLSLKSLDKVSNMMNVLPHKIVLFLNLNVKD